MVEPRAPGRLNVARWVPRSAVNGPGERFVLWLQGCGLHCPGCWNPDTWSFAPRQVMDVEEVAKLVLGTRGIEGLTLTGGEPFAQAPSLVPLARRIRAAGLSLMVFTGHEPDELQSHAARELVAEVDVLVTGRFLLAERDLNLGWRGSRNQRVTFLSNRYRESDEPQGNQLEVHVNGAGEVTMTGFPPDEFMERG